MSRVSATTVISELKWPVLVNVSDLGSQIDTYQDL